MKKSLFLMITLVMTFASIAVSAQDDIYENKNAPANYDANLKAGERAIVAMSGLEIVTIVSKSGGIYRVKPDYGDNIYEFRANAVYPFFDRYEFEQISSANRDLIMPYLECYAKKHNQDADRLKGDAFTPPYFGFSNAEETKKTLLEQQSQFPHLAAKLKNLSALPNTYLEYSYNPAVWYEIATKHAEYLPCVLGDKATKDVAESPWLMAHRDGIKKVLGYVENYQPGSKDSLGSDSEYAVYAVSPKERMAWLKDKNALQFKDAVEEMLKPLADALNQKLPSYPARMEKYPFGTAADFALMKSVFSNPSRYKIFKSGLQQNAWVIDKNSLGIPNARYKNGVIYLRDLQGDHPYCYATHINIIQDYSGGGTYARSRARFILDELVACPAGAN